MKAYKVTVLIIDMDEIGEDELKLVIENTRYPNRCISPEVYSIETVDIGEWDDNHPLNNRFALIKEWERLFPSLKEK
jgi:hypothetical protein